MARTSPRRVSLPTADDLFRSTGGEDAVLEELAEGELAQRELARVRAVPDPESDEGASKRRPSGRVRHDEKMTVYVTADELLDIEHARLALRRDQGLAVDRGRLVREAVALVLADLDANGFDSMLVRRLTER
jgi:hypothetical protein